MPRVKAVISIVSADGKTYTPPLPVSQALLSVAMINRVRRESKAPSGHPGRLGIPEPDAGFRRLCRSLYRKNQAAFVAEGRNFDDYLQEALIYYIRACRDYDPSRCYSKGMVDFVSGRVVARLKNLSRTPRRRYIYAGDFPEAPYEGQFLSNLGDDDVPWFGVRPYAPVDSDVIFNNLRSIAIKAIGDISADKIIADAMDGDRRSIEALRVALESGDVGSLEELREESMPRKYMYIAPHQYVGDRITEETVANGIFKFIEDGYLQPSDVLKGLKSRSKADITVGWLTKTIKSKDAKFQAAIALLDGVVDQKIGEMDAEAYKCLSDDTSGCDSAIFEIDYCPYCGEIFDEDEEEEEVYELGSGDAPEEEDDPAPVLSPREARVAELAGITGKSLADIAKNLKIKGRSRLSAKALREAIVDAEFPPTDDIDPPGEYPEEPVDEDLTETPGLPDQNESEPVDSFDEPTRPVVPTTGDAPKATRPKRGRPQKSDPSQAEVMKKIFAKHQDVVVDERGKYFVARLMVDGKARKVATAFKNRAMVSFTIPRRAFAGKGLQKVRDYVLGDGDGIFYDEDDRKRYHTGRDSVVVKKTAPPSILEKLFVLSMKCVGMPHDERLKRAEERAKAREKAKRKKGAA